MVFVIHDTTLQKYAKITFNFSPNSLYFCFSMPLILGPLSRNVTGKPAHVIQKILVHTIANDDGSINLILIFIIKVDSSGTQYMNIKFCILVNF